MVLKLDPTTAYAGLTNALTVQNDKSPRPKPWVTNMKPGPSGTREPVYRLKDGLTLENTPKPFMEDVVEITPGTTFKAGDRAPFVIGVKGATWGGSRDDIITHGTWNNGVWTVEFSRALDTGNNDDVKLAKGEPATFVVVVRDDHKGYVLSAPVTLKLGGE